MRFDRVICIVLDGCGAGPAPDAAEYGDFGENEGNTLYNTWNAVGSIDAPVLTRMGFFAAGGIETGVHPEADYGRLQEVGRGKDSITGHWEMMGIEVARPFPTYPAGFPQGLIEQFESRIGTKTLGNTAASGTAILAELGSKHMTTGFPVVYTSADSVFQIACHEDVVSIERLYQICRIARDLLQEPHNVGRVIARPFVGSAQDGFTRTVRRKDFPVVPPQNLIDTLCDQIGPTYGIGVIPEVFSHRGFRDVHRTQSNAAHATMLLEALNSDARFIWANFEDFDMLYGHRNDPEGFARALIEFDKQLFGFVQRLGAGDLLILTADHGNDPTTPSTDHSREFAPVCLWWFERTKPRNLGDRVNFAHIGATVADALGLDWKPEYSLLR